MITAAVRKTQDVIVQALNLKTETHHGLCSTEKNWRAKHNSKKTRITRSKATAEDLVFI